MMQMNARRPAVKAVASRRTVAARAAAAEPKLNTTMSEQVRGWLRAWHVAVRLVE